MIVSPLVDAASDQVDVVRAAQSLGIPAVAAIASWDNLTNKGQLRVEPDLVTVWNERQKEEAIDAARRRRDRASPSPARSCSIAGSSGGRASRATAFCAMVGLPADRADRPLHRIVGVHRAVRDRSAPFVRRWIQELRQASDPRVANAAMLIRPHPFNCRVWQTTDFSDLGPVAILPNARFTPSADTARTSFFDSLYYAPRSSA